MIVSRLSIKEKMYWRKITVRIKQKRQPSFYTVMCQARARAILRSGNFSLEFSSKKLRKENIMNNGG